MIIIKHGVHEFKGELLNFDAGSEILIFKFTNGAELQFTNPPRTLITMLLQLGLGVVRNCTVDYGKGMISIDKRNENSLVAEKPKPISNTISKIEIGTD